MFNKFVAARVCLICLRFGTKKRMKELNTLKYKQSKIFNYLIAQ